MTTGNLEATFTLQLREAVAEDYPLGVELLHSAEEDDDRIRAAIADPTSTTYIAYEGQTVIGAAVMEWNDNEAEIMYIAVANHWRGQGFGKKMITALIAEAHSRNMQAVLVGTANSSLDNIAFYQKCGFRMDHVRRDYFNYLPQPVVEDGIPMRDMIVFRLPLE